MSAEPTQASTKKKTKREPTESAGRFIRDVLIVALVLGGGLYFYWYRTQNETAANKEAKEAKDLLFKDNYAQYQEAEAKLKDVLAKYDSTHKYSLAALAELNAILYAEYQLDDRKAPAEEFLRKAQEHTQNLSEEFSAKSLMGIEAGQAANIEDWLKKDVITRGGGGSRIFVSLGESLRAQGKLVEARRAFKAAFDADWRNPRYAAAVAESYLEDGDYQNAGQYYKKGLDSNSDHAISRVGIARTVIRQGADQPMDDHRKDDLAHAGQILELVLKDTANMTPAVKARALVARSELKLMVQDVDGAVADATDAATSNPKYAPAYAAKGFALAAKKDPKAVEMFDKAINTDRYVAAFHYDAAHALIDNGLDSTKALGYLDDFPLDKDDRYFVKYGEALRKLHKPDDAIAKFQEAIKQNPLNSGAKLAVSGIQADKGDYDGAMKTLDEALQIQEFFPDAYAAKAKLLFTKKDWQPALEAYAQALVQWRQGHQSKEKLTTEIQSVKDVLMKAKEKKLAQAWEEEAETLIH